MQHREAILRSLAWHAVIGYPPTFVELQRYAEAMIHSEDLRKLVHEGVCLERRGRFVLPGEEPSFDELEQRERVFPRKWQKIQRLARLLRLMPTIRWFAVCNTTAVGSARDTADIDLFFVTHAHTAWITRTLLAGIARLIGRRPGERDGERDAWCFSFFITDQALSLEGVAKSPHDPYLAWWTMCLLPLFDDGVGKDLWEAQRWVWGTRSQARPWVAWYDRPQRRLWGLAGWKMLDRWCFWVQRHFGSRALWEAAQRGGSDVVLNDQVIKLHLDDRREMFREQYEIRCQMLGIAPYVDAY